MSRLLKSRVPSWSNLGPLEARLLEVLWQRGDATVREVLVEADSGIAYTTVMTTLDRLYKKGLLNRAAEGRAFRYSPRLTQSEIQRAAAGEAIQQIFDSSQNSSLPLSYLIEIVTERDSVLLDELQELIERKRQELKDSEQNGLATRKQEKD
jgi:predicted transcriptional regulator